MQKLDLLFWPCSNGKCDVCESMDWFNEWDHQSLAVDPCVVVETT